MNFVSGCGINKAELRAATDAALEMQLWDSELPDVPLAKDPDCPTEQDFIGLEHWFISVHRSINLVMREAWAARGGKAGKTSQKGKALQQSETLQAGDDLLTLREAAKILNVHPGTVSRWADDGKIKDNGKKRRDRRVLKSSVLLMKERLENEDRRSDAEDLLRDTAKQIPDRH